MLGSRSLFRRLNIRLIPQDEYVLALLYLTGSFDFCKDLRKIAQKKGFMLNEYCLRHVHESGGYTNIVLEASKVRLELSLILISNKKRQAWPPFESDMWKRCFWLFGHTVSEAGRKKSTNCNQAPLKTPRKLINGILKFMNKKRLYLILVLIFLLVANGD